MPTLTAASVKAYFQSSGVNRKRASAISHYADFLLLQGSISRHEHGLILRACNVYKSPRFYRLPFADSRWKFITPLAVFLIIGFAAALGAAIYNQFYKNTEAQLAFSNPPVRSSRKLNFQGLLTDSNGTPITSNVTMQFKLYDAVSSGNTLYTATCSVTPDTTDGIINVNIGDGTCGSEIDPDVFTRNGEVWLSVKVGSDPEMTPRQQIANVPYAINSETLQGMPPGTNALTIPFINDQGDLLIATSSPSIRSTWASENFEISSGKALTLISTGTGGIDLTATGSGTIQMQSNLTSGNVANVTSNTIQAGSLLRGYAGNDLTGYNLLQLQSGSTPTTRFVVTTAGNVGIGSATPGNVLDVSGTTRVSGAVTLSNLTANRLVATGANSTLTSTISSGNLASSVTGTTGTAGNLVFSTSPTFETSINTPVVNNTNANLTLQTTTTGNILLSPASASYNVGIGSATPGNKLDVTGDIYSSGNVRAATDVYVAGTALSANSSTTSGASKIGLFDDTMAYISANTNVQSAIKQLDTAIGSVTGSAGGWTDDGAVVRLTTAGDNVGIGTTAAPQKLTVDGNANLTTGNSYMVNGTSVLNATTLGSGVLTSSLTTVGALSGGSITAGFGTISTGNTITTSGTMGTASTTTFTGATGTFSTSVTTPLVTRASGDLTLQTTTTGNLILSPATASYNVGIGSASPGNKLDVAGTLRASGVVTFTNLTANRGVFTNASNQLYSGPVPSVDLANTISNETGSGNLVFDTSPTFVTSINTPVVNNTSANLTLQTTTTGNILLSPATASYNVGIGSATPGNKLDVTGTGRFSNTLTVSAGGINATGSIIFSSLTSNRLVATGASNTLVSTISSGNLGASVTEGSTGTGAIVLGTSPTFTTRINTPVVNNTGGDLTLQTTTSGNILLSPGTASYNVGIGSASPTQKLDVAGVGQFTRLISTQTTGTAPFTVSSTTKVTNLNADLLDGIDSTGFVQTSGSLFTLAGSSGTNQGINQGDTLLIEAGSNITTTGGATDKVTVATVANPSFGTSVTTPLITRDSGDLSLQTTTSGNILLSPFSNVGIGTTTPSQKLSVNGNINITTGNALMINNGSVLNATTLGSGVVTSSLTTVGALSGGSITAGFGTISTGNTITTSGTMGTASTTTFTGATGTFSTSVTTPSLTNAGTLALSATGANIMTFATNGNTRMTVLSNGNVGIGSTTPGATLDVNGTMKVTLGSDATGDIFYRNSGGTISRLGVGNTSQVLTVSGGLPSWQDVSVSSLKWNALTNPTGTPSPLSLSMGTYVTTFNWATGTAGSNLFNFTTDASANGTGSLVNIAAGTSATVKPLRVAAGAVEALQIDAAGNVGVGSTSPTQKLDVVGSVRSSTLGSSLPVKTNASNTLTTGAINLAGGTEVTGILPLANGGTNKNMTASAGSVAYSDSDSIEFSAVGNAGEVLISNGTSAPSWTNVNNTGGPWTYTGASNYYMYADDYTNAKVGIGTSAPAAWLDIHASGTGLTANYDVLQVTANARTFNTTAGAITNYSGTVVNNSTRSSGANNLTNVALYASATGAQLNYAAIFDQGNVGIGSTTPVALLDVGGTGRFSSTLTASSGLTMTTGTLDLNGNAASDITITGADLTLATATSGNILLSPATASYNVGIGSATPGNKLDVTGTGRFSNTLTVTSGGINATGSIIFSSLTSNRLVATGASNTLVSTISSGNLASSVTGTTGTAGNLVFSTSPTFETSINTPVVNNANANLTLQTTTTGNILLSPASASYNVGIGSATPGNKLDVTGTGRFSSTLTASSGLTMTTGTLDLNGNAASDITITGADLTLATATSGNILLSPATASYNVGIGSATPGNKLDVTGTGRFSNTLTVTSGGIGVTGNSTITGTLTSLTGLTSSGTITFSGLTANRLVATTTGGALTSTISSANLGASVTEGSTGTGAIVLGTSPTFTTSIIAPVIYGGTGASSTLSLAGTNNGAPSAAHILLNSTGQGNVGIGTTSATSTLHVAGSVRITGGSPAAGYVLTATDVGGNTAWQDPLASGLRWNAITSPNGNTSLSMSTHLTTFNWATGTGTNNLFNFTTDASANGTGSLVNIATGTSATLSPLRVAAGSNVGIFVDYFGNVGINTTTVGGYKLNVNGDTNISGALTVSGTFASPLNLGTGGEIKSAGDISLLPNNGGSANKVIVGNAAGNNSFFIYSGTTNQHSSYLGIGGSPSIDYARLWTPGAIDTSQNFVDGSSTALNGMFLTHRARYDDTDDRWEFFNNGDTAAALGVYDGKLAFVNSTNAAVDGNSPIAWATRFFIDTDGEIGVGTIIPGAKLDVRGGIAAGANGTEFAISTAGDITFSNAAHTITGPTSNSLTLSGYGASLALGSSVGNSSFTGNVGIGSVSPQAKLVVSGDAIVADGNSLYVGGPTTSTDGVRMHYTSGQAYIDLNQGATNTGRLNFRTGDNDGASVGTAMSIVGNSGFIGMGTTAPTAKLVVVGTETGNTNFEAARFTKASTNTYGSTYISVSRNDAVTSSSTAQTQLEINSSGAGPFRFGSTYADSLLINTATSNTGAYGSIHFVTGTNTGAAVQNAALTIGGGTRQGNIGIGTVGPTAKLEIVGDADEIYLGSTTSNMIRWRNVGVAAPTFTTRSAGTKLVVYPGVGASSVDYAIGIESNTMWYSVPTAVGTAKHKWYAGTTEIMTLQGDGNLGIKDTTPMAVLDVGSPTASVPAMNIGRIGGQPSIKSTSDYLIMDSNTQPAVLNYFVSEDVILAYGGGTGGNVGIGVTSPGAKLDIAGSGGTWTTSNWGRAIELDNATALKFATNGTTRHGIGQTTGGLYFIRSNADNNSVAATYDMFISDTGNVGIGTTTNAYKLDVNGTTNLGGAVNFPISTWLTSDDGELRLHFGNGGPTYIEGDDIIFRNEADSHLAIIDGPTGNVGFGTTNPVRPFQLTTSYNDTYPTMIIQNTNTGSSSQARLHLIRATEGTTVNDGFAMGVGASYAGFADYENRHVSFYTGSGNASTQRMVIANNGNISIGTTTTHDKEFQLIDTGGTLTSFEIKNTNSSSSTELRLWAEDAGGARESAHLVLDGTTGNMMFYLYDGTNSQAAQSFGHGTTGIAMTTQRGERLCHAGSNAGTVQRNIQVGDCTTTGADLAEFYIPAEPMEPGDIVSIDPSGNQKVIKATKQKVIFGIVSTDPTTDGIMGEGDVTDPSRQPVGLVGRVPVKVSLENGQIRAGDPITISSKTGVGMKATEPGTIIGYALENYDGSTRISSSVSYQENNRTTNHKNRLPAYHSNPGTWASDVGKIMVLAQPMWYDPHSTILAPGDLEVLKKSLAEYEVVNTKDGTRYSTIGAFSNAVIGKLTAGLISTQELTTNAITIGGKSLETYVRDIIAQVQQENPPQNNSVTVVQITPPPAPTPGPVIALHDSVASASSTIALETTDNFSSLSVKIKDKEVARIDQEGNATLSGTLSAQAIETKDVTTDTLAARDATISGTLVAEEIKAKNIESIAARVNELNAEFARMSVATISASTGINPSVLTSYDLNVANSAVVGDLFIQDNAIVALGQELRLSALSQVTLFDGTLTIARNGTLTTDGEIIAKGGVKTDEISPITDNVTVSLPAATSELKIENENNVEVASINASGAAYFQEGVDFRKFDASASAVLASSDTWTRYGQSVPSIITNNESSGNARLPANNTEVLIANTKVKNNSLVYVTATSSTNNQILYVVAKQDGAWFKVKTDQPLPDDVTFNWWIL